MLCGFVFSQNSDNIHYNVQAAQISDHVSRAAKRSVHADYAQDRYRSFRRDSLYVPTAVVVQHQIADYKRAAFSKVSQQLFYWSHVLRLRACVARGVQLGVCLILCCAVRRCS
jgi:hypothetical protein